MFVKDSTSLSSWHFYIPGFSKGSKTILGEISLSIESGKIISLLGKSGIGKTTFLRCLSGLEGKKKHTKDKVKIAYMAQQDLLLPWMNVIDNLTIGSLLRKQKSDLDQAHYFLDQLGLKDCEHLYPYQLSAGMKQRVAFGRTLMENSQILLLDEPFASLDAITRYNLQTFACNLLKDKAVIFVTHDPLEAIRISHEIYVFQGCPAVLSEKILVQGPQPPRPSVMEGLYDSLMQLLNAECS